MKIDVMQFWTQPPPSPSPGLTKWLAKIDAGWRPNKRIRRMGYHSSSEYYGVYIWEYLNVLLPKLNSVSP